MQIHRWTGRLFLLGVAVVVSGAIGLAVKAIGAGPLKFGLMGWATSWLVTTAVAYYTIRKGLVALHKEWTNRAYVVAFAFVFFRILHTTSRRARSATHRPY